MKIGLRTLLLSALFLSLALCNLAKAQETTQKTTLAKPQTIGISVSVFDDNFVTILRKKMAAHIATLNGVSSRSEDAQGDILRQQSQIENLIASGVDGLIILLVDADSGVAISNIVQQSGIPAVYINNAPTNVEQLPKGQAFVGFKEIEAGRLQADYICSTLKGKGKAVVLQGLLGSSVQRERTKGIHQGLAKDECKGIEIVEEQTANWFRTNALDLVTNWLTAGFEFDAVFGENDEMALGAIQALKSAEISLDKMVVTGVDGTPDALAAIKSGDLDITIFQNAEQQASQAIDNLQLLIQGQDIDRQIYIPFETITADNVDEYANRN